MDNDITSVPYIVLASRIIERCYSDWTHFCARAKKDGNTNSSKLRLALSQFCRHQRELFIKLYTLHPYARPENQAVLNKILQESVTSQQILPNILNYINQTLWSTRESHLQMGLMAPPPNLSAAVDVLSTGNYTRLPVLLEQTVKMADSGDVQLIDYGIEEFDLVRSRLEDEYLITFNRSAVPKDKVELVYKDGHVDYVVKGYFKVSLIYDLSRWHVLDASLEIAEELNVQSTGKLKEAFLQLIFSSVDAAFNTTAEGEESAPKIKPDDVDVFALVFTTGMRFFSKLLLEQFREQSLNYKSNSNKVVNVNFTCQNSPIVTCANVFSGLISLEVEMNRKLPASEGACQESFYNKLNTLVLSFDIDADIKDLYKTNFPFHVSVKGIPEALNMDLLNSYINRFKANSFDFHYWIDFFYYVLESILVDMLKDVFKNQLSHLTLSDAHMSNIATLLIHDKEEYLGRVYLSRFTGNLLFKVSNKLLWVRAITRKLIESESISIESFKLLISLITTVNRLDRFKDPLIDKMKSIHPLTEESVISYVEEDLGGRMNLGELKDTDAADAILFDSRCYSVGNRVFRFCRVCAHGSNIEEDEESSFNMSNLFILICEQMKYPELKNLGNRGWSKQPKR